MLHTYPDFYSEFHCIADKCPMSCCKGWLIEIDEGSLDAYEAASGGIGNRLRNSIDYEEGTFCQYQGRCAMLDDDELCSIQKELGEEYLSLTCTMYPRHVEEFMDVREYSLALSCPEAARIMLNKTNRPSLTSREDGLFDEEEEFDYFLYENLVDCRMNILDLIWKEDISILQVLCSLLSYGSDLQDCVDEDRLFDLSECRMPDGNLLPVETPFNQDRFTDPEFQKRMFSYLFEMEMLEDDWMEILNSTLTFLKGQGGVERAFSNIEENSVQARQLLTFWILSYFCGAVYDDSLYPKIAMAVYSTLWIFMIAGALKSADYEIREENPLIFAAYRYAREIEHSDPNLDALEAVFLKENEK